MQMARQPKISDLDVLVEFPKDARISLLDIIHLKHNLEDELSIRVDVVEIPLTEKAQKHLKIRKAVPVFERYVMKFFCSK
jgi:predicted nucleotidyltransferase